MSRTYYSQFKEGSRLDGPTIQYPIELGDPATVENRDQSTPFTRDKRVTALFYRLQRDEEERLEEMRQSTRSTGNADNREPLRQINLTSSSRELLSATNQSSCLAPKYDKSVGPALENGEDRLSDAEILALLKSIQDIDKSLVDIPSVGTNSLYSGLNTLLLNKQSIYNKQREQRVNHHLSEIRCHIEMLLVSSPQRDLLLKLLDSDASSSCPSPLSLSVRSGST